MQFCVLHLWLTLNEKTKPVNLFADEQISVTVGVLMLCRLSLHYITLHYITFKCQFCTMFRHDGTAKKFASSYRVPVGYLSA